MYTPSQIAERKARIASIVLKHELAIERLPDMAVMLGSGWGDSLVLENERSVTLESLAPGTPIEELPGHARRVAYGFLPGSKRPIIAIRGRVHVNESLCAPDITLLIRLQIQMCAMLDVKTFVFTAAVGSLTDKIKGDAIVVINKLCTTYAPDMPLFTGEFCSPEDHLDRHLCDIAVLQRKTIQDSTLHVHRGGHVMVRGPFFEGRKLDKALLKRTKAKVVGMSILPETCVASLVKGSRVLALGYVTNNATEEHSHEENLKRAKARSEELGRYLTAVLEDIALNR